MASSSRALLGLGVVIVTVLALAVAALVSAALGDDHESRAAERGAAEPGAAEPGAAERGAAERGAAERGAAERGAAGPDSGSASGSGPESGTEEHEARGQAVPASEEADGEATRASGEPTTGLPVGRVPVAADDPAGLAEQITLAERTIRSDDREPEEVAAAGHLQQVAYRRLTRNPDWRDEVLARVPEAFHHSVRAHTDAARGLTQLHEPREELPPWRIVAPAPAGELRSHYQEAERAFGVPWEYLAAINLIETRMGRIEGTSVAGAQGPMQFMPATWEAYGRGDVHDDRDAILGAGRYLAASGAPGDMAGALFAYNRSQHYVRAVTAYAERMRADPRMFEAYYHWEVYYVTVGGDTLLPIGYDRTG